MQPQEEWRFEFQVSTQAPIPRAVIITLQNEVVAWAESRSLGFVGGHGPVTPEVSSAATAWRFEFDLGVNTDDLLIPEPQAAELLAALQGWCSARGMSFTGGFRALTPQECGQDA